MKRIICNISIVILIIIIMISCLYLFLIYDDRFGSGGFSSTTWFQSTSPDNEFSVTAIKTTNDSPLALYAKTDVEVTIKHCKDDELIQSFSTSVEYAGKDNYRVDYNDDGISLLFFDSDNKLERIFYFSYDSLSNIGSNIRGD